MEVSAAVLFESDFTCCKCRDRTKPTQIHHIDEDPSNNVIDNLSVLCLLCHDETQINGGFGRKLNAALVTKYRDDWIGRVKNRREEADKLAITKMAGLSSNGEPNLKENAADEETWRSIPAAPELVSYVESLPAILNAATTIAKPKMAGSTMEMIEGTYFIVDVVVQILVHLSQWFPDDHFGGISAQEYFSQLVSTKAIWRRALATPGGEEMAGTMAGISSAIGVLKDVAQAVDEVVSALLYGREGFYLTSWRNSWTKAITL
jgi:hypothetical protein